MDQNRFDRLSQTLAGTSIKSRRSVLAALGVAILSTLTGIVPDAASARGKGKRGQAKRRQGNARGRLRASGGTTSDDKSCLRAKAGTTCQKATFVDRNMLRPACTCEGKATCTCPDAVACPNHLACDDGRCLTSCRVDADCAKGHVCGPTGTCACADGWSGGSCSDAPPKSCSDYATCDACYGHVQDEGCVWCLLTVLEEQGVCSDAGVCLVPREFCAA